MPLSKNCITITRFHPPIADIAKSFIVNRAMRYTILTAISVVPVYPAALIGFWEKEVIHPNSI
jgi:hypothetical protein